MGKLTEEQKQFIPKILKFPSIAEACNRVGITREIYHEWLKDEDFKRELTLQRDMIVKEAMERLKSATEEAVEVLIKLLTASKQEVRRLVCRDIIDYALRSREVEDIEERLEKVERIILERRSYR